MEKLIDNIMPELQKYIHEEDLDLPQFYSYDYYEWYYTYGKLFKPKTLLEIGVRRGYSAISLGLGSQQIEEYFLIDNAEDGVPLAEGGANIQTAFPKAKINMLQQNSQDIKNISEFVPTFVDMVHIDGRHDFKGATNDLKLTYSICSNIIVLDDVGHHKNEQGIEKYIHGIEEAILYFLAAHKEFVINSHICNWTGNIILQRRKPL